MTVPATGRDTSVQPGDYARWRGTTLGRITEELEQRRVLELAGPVAGARVLDVGCGDGAYARAAAQRGAHVTGVDPSRSMLDAARARADDRHVELELLQGELPRLPFDDGSFAVVLAVTVLCFVDDAAGAVREMSRVLSPGGRLVVGELGRLSTWAAWRRLRGWLGSSLWRDAHFRTAGELKRLAQESGLEVESVRGAIYYPPLQTGARLLQSVDRLPSRITTAGAAFVAMAARRTDASHGPRLHPHDTETRIATP